MAEEVLQCPNIRINCVFCQICFSKIIFEFCYHIVLIYNEYGSKIRECIGHYQNLPFNLPSKWAWTTLGQIGKWKSGSTPDRLNKDYYGGNIPWLKTGDLNDGYVDYISETITEKALNETSVKLNPKGSVLIAMYGATIGKIGILTYPATTNQACCACDVFHGIEKEYLFYFLLSHKEEFIKLGGGGAQPNISKEKIINTYIPIPPYAEQKRIVAAVHKVFTQIDIIMESL